jgi:hypothetical protein
MHPYENDPAQPDWNDPLQDRHSASRGTSIEKRNTQPACFNVARYRRHTLAMMTVLLGSVLLLSACNPITSQNIKLSAAAASGTGAGMMRPMTGMRDAGMRELANPDLIGRVISVTGDKVKVELMESSTGSAGSSSRNSDQSAGNKGSTSSPGATSGTSSSDYTATGKHKTITMSDEVQITQMSTLMERAGRGEGMSRNADGTGGGNWIGAGSRSDTSATGTGQQGNTNDPTGAGSMGANSNPAMPGDPSGNMPGFAPPGAGTGSDRPERGTGSSGSDMTSKQAELKTGDIVMIWYEEGEAIAKRIVILPMQ